MTRTIVFRRIVGVVAVALALGTIAGPASARTFDFNSNGSLVQQPPPSTSPAANPASGGSGIEWGYVAIGSSAAALALIGVGAVATGRRRSQGRATAGNDRQLSAKVDRRPARDRTVWHALKSASPRRERRRPNASNTCPCPSLIASKGHYRQPPS